MRDHADIVREGLRNGESQDMRFVAGIDEERGCVEDWAARLAALDALEAELATSEKSRAEYIEETIRLRAVLFDAETERDALDEAAKQWRLDIEAELVQLRAERDEWKRDRDYVWSKGVELKERCEAAEADARGLWSGVDPRIVTLRRERDAAEGELRGYREALIEMKARAEAVEVERDEANRLLREVVKADKQDAQMGYPIPGDSCMGAFIGLVLMEYLDKLPPKEAAHD